MSSYFAHISAAGTVRFGQFPCAIGVLEMLDKLIPIDLAFGAGRTEDVSSALSR
jgi:hypothetical protein